MRRPPKTTGSEDEKLLALAVALQTLRPPVKPNGASAPKPARPPSPAARARPADSEPAPSCSADSAAPVGEPSRTTRPPRARRKKRVRLGRPDFPLIEQLARTGFAAERHARLAGVRPARVRALVAAGFLERGVAVVDHAFSASTSVEYLRLTPKSRAFARRYLDLVLYQTNTRQVGHDLRLADIYWSLGPAERASWQTEQEVIATLKQQGAYERGHAVDAAIEVDGALVAVEVAVGYDARRLAMKQATIARHFGGRALLLTQQGLTDAR